MAEASPGARPRPLSPHLLHWRWHITMAASIATRVSGVALYAGWLVLAGLVLALAGGREAYGAYAAVLTSIPGQIVLFGIAVALFYHLAAGLRHLFWDFGRGLQPRVANATAWGAFAVGLICAIALFAAAWTGGAGA